MRLSALLSTTAFFCLLAGVAAAQTVPVERVVVYGTLSDSDIGQDPDKIPGELQSLSADAVTAGHGATVLEALGDRTAGVSLSTVSRL